MLKTLVRQMLDGGRQTVDPLALPPQATSSALEALRHDGVLRDLPVGPGNALGPVTFAHSVLFDYAVAVLALGDTQRPDSLADVLDDDPNLAVTARPSLEYRLAIAWADDVSRRGFWHLALRLVSTTPGHLLAALTAAKVAASEIEISADLEDLAEACIGAAFDPDDRWKEADARGLVFLVAASIARQPRPQPALDALAALTSRLAAYACSADDTSLALLAGQVPIRAVGMQPAGLHAGASRNWTTAAVDCMTLALTDLNDPRRAALAQVSARLLAAVASHDPHATADVVNAVIAPDTLQAWGVVAVQPLIDQIPEIAGTAPELAVAIGTSVWEYEETRDDPTPLIDSAILGLISNRRQDLESARYGVAMKFPALLDANPMGATHLFLRIVELPRMYRWDNSHPHGDLPWIRNGEPLESAGGNRALLEMTDAFIRKLEQLTVQNETGNGTETRTADQIVSALLKELHNSGVWQRLLQQVAKADSSALNHATLPILMSSSTYANPYTWLAAGHIAAHLAPSLIQQDHLRLEVAILGLVDAGTSATGRAEIRDRLQQRTRMLLNALDARKISDSARRRIANHPTDAPDPLPGLPEDQRGAFGFWTGSPDAPEPDSLEDLANQIRATAQQSRDQNPQARLDGLSRLIQLWAELKKVAAESGARVTDPQLAGLRLEMAERLSTAADITPETELGTEVFSSLLAALPTAAAADEDSGALWSSTAGPAWELMPSTSAISGMVNLLHRDNWRAAHKTELATSLTALLDSPNPIYRYLSSHALPGLHPTPDELIVELERRLHSETDRHTATYLMQLLAGFTHSHPQRIDQILQRLAALPQWAVLTPSPEGEQALGPADQGGMVVGLLAILAASHNTHYARSTVNAWLTQPMDNPQRAMWTTMRLRDLLNPASPLDRSAQERTFAILELSLNQLRSTSAETERTTSTSNDMSDRPTNVIKIADSLVQQLYFASGAFDQQNRSSPPLPRGDQSRFYSLALPLLQGLSEIHLPGVTHRIVQIADHIRAAQPKLLLLLAANAVTGDKAYPREPMGLDATLQLIRHYTADHRSLVLNDPQCTTAVRILLEAFIRLGWDRAIELAEELDELFT